MKHLILMRHAKSSWSEPSLDDFHRPLNNRGRRDAPAMGDRLAALDCRPDLLLSSPAKRALATAYAVAPRVGCGLQDIVQEPRIYEADPDELLQIVQGLEDLHTTVLMFGHNPGFTRLVEILGSQAIGNLPTSGIVWIVFESDHWRDVAPGTGHTEVFDYPKLHRP